MTLPKKMPGRRSGVYNFPTPLDAQASILLKPHERVVSIVTIRSPHATDIAVIQAY